ncbi:hypothetical protein GCM10011609_85710 [Lentzea pudingi]|uniref:Uncharacterized protein n=1 Tax=Lentzea pudingi TaxID=1789439 RepID=A0ABQ2IVT0_9PSEU|nr:hypothetical protein GCM10011609_85710 [Lentzea pudingi]
MRAPIALAPNAPATRPSPNTVSNAPYHCGATFRFSVLRTGVDHPSQLDRQTATPPARLHLPPLGKDLDADPTLRYLDRQILTMLDNMAVMR